MVRAIGYSRVSTEEQASEGLSISAQSAKIRGYADLHDIELIDVVIDAGVSGKNLKRPGLAKCLELLLSGEADVLIIFKLDRLTRSLDDWRYLINNVFGENSKNSLMSVSDEINTKTANGKFFLNLMVTVAEWERETISDRTKVVMAHKKSLGQHCGAPGYGSMMVNKILTVNDAEMEVTELINDLQKKGFTLEATANQLNSLGYSTKRDKQWNATAVSRVRKQLSSAE
jgi:site-specific DNA recombinase